MMVSSALKRFASIAGFHVVRNHHYPPNTFMGLAKHPFGTVIDVGANSGQFARATMKHIPEASYYCFEPTPAAFNKLRTWASLKAQVVAINAAVGERSSLVYMNLHVNHSTSSSILQTTDHSHVIYPFTEQQSPVPVTMTTLDEYFGPDPSKLRADVLLKLDVQGYELSVLRGATQLLDHVRVCIVEVCIDPLYQGQSQFEGVFDVLRGHRFQYIGNFDQHHGRDGHVIAMDCAFSRTT